MSRINWEAAYLNYYAERAGLIGHDARDVRGWLEAHPDYDGEIYANWNDGSDDFLVTDIFRPEPDDDAETIPETTAPAKQNPSLNDVTALVCADIVRTVRRVA